jgi:hypothetical protein
VTLASKDDAGGALLRRRAPVLVILSAGLLSLLIGQWAFYGFPHSADEYVYLYQAKTLLAGRLVNPPLPEVGFQFTHTLATPSETYGKYPPGWAFVLALGELVGAPFVVNPLLTALTLWLTFTLTRALFDRRTALIAILLLGTSPFVLLSGGSLYAHPLAALCLLALVASLWRYGHGFELRWLLAGAACLGALLLTRPFDAALVALALVPVGLVHLARRPQLALRHGAAAAVVALGACALYLLYNLGTTGDAFTTGYTRRGLSDDAPALLGLRYVGPTLRRLREYSLFAFPALLFPLALLAVYRQLPRAVVGSALLIVLASWVGYAAFPVTPPPRLGPRYLYGAHWLMTLLLAAGMTRVVGPRWLAPLVATVVAGQLFATASMVREVRGILYRGTGLYRAATTLERAIGRDHALVVVSGPSGTIPPQDLLRNDPELEQKVIFVRRVPQITSAPGNPQFEERRVYVWDGAGGVPTLWSADPRAPIQRVMATEPEPSVLRRRMVSGWIAVFGRNDCQDPPYLTAMWNSLFPPDRISDVQRFSDGALGPCPGFSLVLRREEVGIPEDLPRKLALTSVWRSFLTVPRAGRYAFVLDANEEATLRVGGADVVKSVRDAPRTTVLWLEAGAHALAISHHTRWAPPRLSLDVRRLDGPDEHALTTQLPLRMPFHPMLAPSGFRLDDPAPRSRAGKRRAR